MQLGYRSLASLVLALSLATPVAMVAAASPQDNKDQESRQSDNNQRYYHKGQKDYHTWNSNEDRAYQRYQSEHHEKRAFVKLSAPQQNSYWNWRHNNPDRP